MKARVMVLLAALGAAPLGDAPAISPHSNVAFAVETVLLA